MKLNPTPANAGYCLLFNRFSWLKPINLTYINDVTRSCALLSFNHVYQQKLEVKPHFLIYQGGKKIQSLVLLQLII